MKPITKMITAAIGAAMLFTAAVQIALAEQYNDLEYYISDGKITITRCDYSSTNVNIPSQINGMPVTGIGYGAFSDCTALNSVNIPDSVTSIDFRAFHDCTALRSINIPDSITSIGSEAFSGCVNLAGLNIPDSVTSIHPSAFSGTRFELRENGILYAGTHLIRADKDISGSVTIREGTTTICSNAFGNYSSDACDKITSVTIPDSVTNIGESAFYDCKNLAVLNMGSGVREIHDGAFSGCESLTIVNIPDLRAYLNIEYPERDDNYYYLSSCPMQKANNLLVNGEPVTDVVIPPGVENIPDYAFSGCHSLTSVIIPDGVKSIGNNAFDHCENLTGVTIGNDVEVIGNEAFYYSEKLSRIDIGNGVRYIGRNAFRETEHYQKNYVDVKQGRTTLCRELYIGRYLIDIYSWNNDIDWFSVREGTLAIASDAFSWCNNIKHIYIPDSVRGIGNGAFRDCKALISLEIPQSVEIIGDELCSGCGSLVYISFPDRVRKIGEDAFSGCGQLEAITIGNYVTDIGTRAFYETTNLKNVYYHGTWSEWQDINIADVNPYLTIASISYEPIPDSKVRVHINNTNVDFDQMPMIVDGRTLVPLRAIFEALDADVRWDAETRTVTASKAKTPSEQGGSMDRSQMTIMMLTIDSNIMYVNGKQIELDVPACIVNERTMIPARAVAEAFGCNVSWNENERMVEIVE